MTSADDRMTDVDFHRKHRVRWIETDLSGFVHFPNYIRMMEETEYAFLRSLGLSIVTEDDKGVFGFPRVSTSVEVRDPATADDELDIWLKIVGNDGVKIGYEFEIASPRGVVAMGRFLIACCRFVPGKLPRAILIPDPYMERLPRR